MNLTSYEKDFFAWAQKHLPIVLSLDETQLEITGSGSLQSQRGLWNLQLSHVKGTEHFRFNAALCGTKESVDVAGIWKYDSETLASVLSSLPQLTPGSNQPVNHRDH